jgi:RES domain-containing protein
MRLWRCRGYGLTNSGRWNTTGRPVTYCSTVPSLTALEKRAHVTDISLHHGGVRHPDDVSAHNN